LGTFGPVSKLSQAGRAPRTPRRCMNKKASTTLPGTVDKIVKPRAPGKREQAQIEVEGADHIYKEIRIENALTDDLGQEVRMEPGDKVNVTITSEPEPDPL
jgi:hypothetical protein